VRLRRVVAGAEELAKVRRSLLWHKRAASYVAIALVLGTGATAGAQTDEPQAPERAPAALGTPTPRPAPATPPPGTKASPPVGPGATPGSERIAPPSSGASAGNVVKAQKTAEVSALTPILPSPTNPLRPAFQLYAEVDLPVLGVGLVFASARLFRSQRAFCAPLCDRNDLNAFDRTTAGFWSPAWGTASDVGLYGIAAAAATLLVADEGFVDALNDSIVVAESALSATALATILSLSAGRPRPFLYGEKAPLSDRNSAGAGLSLVSSHTAVSFAIATSTFIASRRLHSASKVPYLVMAIGGAIATFVGTARVMAGEHFITDAIGGAMLGTATGVLIPSLHASPVKVVPVVSDTQRGLGIIGVF
jgi:membrane-associated phospholipid phosphatase